MVEKEEKEYKWEPIPLPKGWEPGSDRGYKLKDVRNMTPDDKKNYRYWILWRNNRILDYHIREAERRRKV